MSKFNCEICLNEADMSVFYERCVSCTRIMCNMCWIFKLIIKDSKKPICRTCYNSTVEMNPNKHQCPERDICWVCDRERLCEERIPATIETIPPGPNKDYPTYHIKFNDYSSPI